MGLAIFDLDNTLIGGDSDYLWGCFLVDKGAVDRAEHDRKNRQFYADYQAGTLDIHRFLSFQLRPLAEHDTQILLAWRDEFIERSIRPIVLEKSRTLLDRHRERKDTLVIITATNRFITEPIAELFDVTQLIATEPEMVDHRYTGSVTGLPCYREGKVKRLNDWLARHDRNLRDSWFYSDSHNDLPLLEKVDHPVAVDPDAELEHRARESGWPIISLR